MKYLLLFFCAIFFNVAQARNLTGHAPERIYESYSKLGAWGMLTSIDVSSCDPGLIRSEDAIRDYVHKLCDLIEMKRFGDTVVVHFGEDEEVAGYSMTQLIETSLISGHFANKTNNIYIDVFSCKEYDPYEVAEFTKNYFQGEDFALNILLRK